MSYELKCFLDKIKYSNLIDENKKLKLYSYMKQNLFKFIRIYTKDEFDNLFEILKEIDFDADLLDKMLNTSLKISNALNEKKESNYVYIPEFNYFKGVYDMFKNFGIDFNNYDNSNLENNLTFSGAIYRTLVAKKKLNDEISIIELAKKIYDKHYSNCYQIESYCLILCILDKIDKGLSDLISNGIISKGTVIYESDEFMDLFRANESLKYLPFINIIRYNYDFFGNRLFSIIGDLALKFYGPYPDHNYIYSRLNSLKNSTTYFQKKQSSINESIIKNNEACETNIKNQFEKLLDSIKNTRNISDESKNLIIENISDILRKYNLQEENYVDEKLRKFYENCEKYINKYIIPNNKNDNIRDLITNLVSECREFFIEYDYKKFEMITEYILKNTNLDLENLKEISTQCAEFFKSADINKLNQIKLSLIDFEKYLAKCYSFSRDGDGFNLFDSYVLNYPNLAIVANDNFKGVIDFIEGKSSLKDYGYLKADFSLNSDFFTNEFFEKLINGDKPALFNASMDKFVNNLGCLETLCSYIKTNFNDFNINEDLFLELLCEDFSKINTALFSGLENFFTSQDIVKLIGANPKILFINEDELYDIFKFSIFNSFDNKNISRLMADKLFSYGKNSNNVREMPINFSVEGVDNVMIDDILFNLFNNQEDAYELIDYISSKSQIDKLIDEIKNCQSEEDFYREVKKLFEYCDATYKNGIYPYDLNLKIYDGVFSKVLELNNKINDCVDLIESKKEMIESYKKTIVEKEDFIEKLKKMHSEYDTDFIKNKIEEAINNISNDSPVFEYESEDVLLKSIDELVEKKNFLEEIVDYISKMMMTNNECDVSNSMSEPVEFVVKKSFCFNDFMSKSKEVIPLKDAIIKLLGDDNLIVFHDEDIDLSGIKDRSYINKVNDFLGREDTSILSKTFMDTIYTKPKSGVVEKYNDEKRKGVFSRRDGETPVRIFFIPLFIDKGFTCNYIIDVSYNNGQDHQYAGCSTKLVFDKVMSEAKALKERLTRMLKEGDPLLIDYIRSKNVKYEEIMKPIFDRINKKNNFNM